MNDYYIERDRAELVTDTQPRESIRCQVEEIKKLLYETNGQLGMMITELLGKEAKRDELKEPNCLNDEFRLMMMLSMSILDKTNEIRNFIY